MNVPTPPEGCIAYQNLDELGALWDLVASRPHARVLEIGSLYGGTLWHWAHLPKIEVLASIDLVLEHEPMRPGILAARAEWPMWFDGVPLYAFELDSHSKAALVAASEIAGRPGFDFVFIDGDHTFDGVRADWLAYSPLVRPGGIVAFHDTWPNGTRHEPGVVRWIDELRHHLPTIEFTDPDGAGIVAVFLPKEP